MPHRRPRPLVFTIWFALACLLVAGGALLAHFGRHISKGLAGPTWEAAPRVTWLLTRDGQRRGLVLASDLTRDGAAWSLWANGGGMSPLSTIDKLCPKRNARQESFGFNGGFWDEYDHPVGICAGERGIHGARSHAGGFAIGGGRAWIGPLVAHVRLEAMTSVRNAKADAEEMTSLVLTLNPRPLPRRSSYLIDPMAYHAPLKLETAARIVLLRRDSRAPLRFNTVHTLHVDRILTGTAGAIVKPPAPGNLLWFIPESERLISAVGPRAGAKYRLKLTLDPVQGEVRLATCAGPRLIKAGQIVAGLGERAGNGDERTWRTAVGCDASGQRVWVVLLSRGADGLPGATLNDTALTLRELGASEGLNLDGGSSTSVWSTALDASERQTFFPLREPIHHAIFFQSKLSLKH